ncbi:hypothetical protein N8198_05885 [Gammaproteobacteria bacterium]|nr:hypothetical protein [Gammaproteobacteria bacterium]
MVRRGLSRLIALIAFCIVVSCANAQRDFANSTTYSYRCEGLNQIDQGQVIVVTLNGDRGHLFSSRASQAIARQPGARGFAGDDVYYLPAQPADLAPRQTAEITIKGQKLANCKNDPRAAVWEGAKLRGISYRAIGQEPAWLLEIDRQKGFLLVTGYGEKRQQFPYVEAVTDKAQRTSRYTLDSNGEGITITIQGRDCQDSMSGETFSSQVEISWREQNLRGCGRALH